MSHNRGIRTLFNDMISVPVSKAGVGRDSRLNNLRNECLIHRYIFVYQTTRWNYQLLVRAIAKEFFLSPETVKEIITDNDDFFKKTREGNHSPAILKEKYPHINWETPLLENYI